MKTSNLVLSIVIAAVIIYLIYKAYTNYQATGDIFRSVIVVPGTTPDVVVVEGSSSQRISPFVASGGKVMNGHS